MADPVAIEDYFYLSENRTVTGNLFANNAPLPSGDYDPDGDTLTVVGVSVSASVGIDPSSIDVDYGLLTSGFVHVEANGDFVLDWGSDTPGEGMGLDETTPAVFYYRVTDGNGGFATGSVIYTIVSTSQTHNGDNVAGDVINAGLGNDVVNGFGGADTLSGENGNDTLDGGAGVDDLDGGDGDDTLRTDSNLQSNEAFRGGAGSDTLEVAKAGSGSDGLSFYSATLTSIEKLSMAVGGSGGSTSLSFHASQFGAQRSIGKPAAYRQCRRY